MITKYKANEWSPLFNKDRGVPPPLTPPIFSLSFPYYIKLWNKNLLLLLPVFVPPNWWEYHPSEFQMLIQPVMGVSPLKGGNASTSLWASSRLAYEQSKPSIVRVSRIRSQCPADGSVPHQIQNACTSRYESVPYSKSATKAPAYGLPFN